MTERIQKRELMEKMAVKMSTDVKTTEAWATAFSETLCEAFAAGQSVTIPGLGSFYLRPEHHGCFFNSTLDKNCALSWGGRQPLKANCK